MTAIRPYYAADTASARHYDLITAADRSIDGDIDLYAGLTPAGGSILELGAGTGRVAIPLAERGFEVTGLDIAAPMLAQAEAKRERLPADVAARLRFVRGDLRSLALGRRFDAIIATFYTLAHLQPSVAWKQAFAGMARHLAPGGVIGLHLPDPEKMGGPAPRSDAPVMRRMTDDGSYLTLFVARQAMNAKTGRFDLLLDYVSHAPDGRELKRSRELYSLFHGDPGPYAAQAGLRRRGDAIPIGGTGSIVCFEAATVR